MGLPVAAVHSQADRDSLHVLEIGESVAIGPAPAAQSYLNIEAILEAAAKVGANAVHPGIGFLSEDPAFCEAVESQGLIFIGPRPETLRRFADKWAAKHEARQADVSVIGGGEGSSRDAAAIEAMIRDTMRLPVVLKAAAGGGGRGVRVVRSPEGLRASIESAMREAQSSFGRPDLIVEEFVENARHLEVQIVGDGRGHAIHLFERECSLQRRFQKIVEEAPAANLSTTLRDRIIADAVRLARRVDYRNVGTMEFLVAADRHYFLECNPRLQVEHTVTEAITGVDLVEIQIQVATNAVLPISQEQVRIKGHAIQARVYAEDTSAGFIPSTGRLQRTEFPHDEVRIETGVQSGSEITPHYDSMIAKLIAHSATRSQALDRLVEAIKHTVVFGVETNLGFLVQLLEHPVVRAGTADNRFIDRELAQIGHSVATGTESVAVAAALFIRQSNFAADSGGLTGLWSGRGDLLGWYYTDGTVHAPGPPSFSLVDAGDRHWGITVGKVSAAGLTVFIDSVAVAVSLQPLSEDHWQVEVGSCAFTVVADVGCEAIQLQGPLGAMRFTVVPFLSVEAAADSLSGQVRAPMMGVIAKVNVRPGDIVSAGDVLVVQESMKMELIVEAPCDGKVAAVGCAVGTMVERHQVIVEIEPEAEI
jgi:3-methylcrotonyl-CoA carboxylase alpha subunit